MSRTNPTHRSARRTVRRADAPTRAAGPRTVSHTMSPPDPHAPRSRTLRSRVAVPAANRSGTPTPCTARNSDALRSEAGGRAATGATTPVRASTFALAATLLTAALAGLASAATTFGGPGTPRVSLSGFGTLGYAVLDDPDAEYRTGSALDGADEDGSLEVDTRLGLQLDAVFDQRWSATLQTLAREGEDGDPELGLEWGFVRFLTSDSTTLRVGRMSLPVFSLSDYREVGYANTFLRPPEDVYTQIPVRRFDGVDFTYDVEFGPTLLRAQIYYGGSSGERIIDGLEPDVTDTIGVNLVSERGPLALRVGYLDSRLELDSASGDIARVHAGILNALPLVPTLAEIEEDFDGSRVPLRFAAVGLRWDPGAWFVDTEYAQRRVDSWVSDLDSWSLAAGARFGAFTPYGFASTLAEAHGDRRVDLPDDPRLDALELGINALYEPRDQSSVGLGLRWDPLPGRIAVKVQAERLSREVTGTSFLRRQVDDGSDDGEDVTLFSAAIDFVF